MQKAVKRNKKQWLKLALLLFAAIFLASLALDEFHRWRNLREDIDSAREDIEETEESVSELSGKLSLISDPEYLEKEARRTLNVKRAGEEVYLVVGLDEIKQEENFSFASLGIVEQNYSVWDNIGAWFNYFFGQHGI